MTITALVSNDIPLNQRQARSARNRPKHLGDDYLSFIKEVALASIPDLDPDKIHETEDICKPIWDSTDPDEHKDIGTAISYFEATRQLPLLRLENAPDNAAQYRVIQSQILNSPASFQRRSV